MTLNEMHARATFKHWPPQVQNIVLPDFKQNAVITKQMSTLSKVVLKQQQCFFWTKKKITFLVWVHKYESLSKSKSISKLLKQDGSGKHVRTSYNCTSWLRVLCREAWFLGVKRGQLKFSSRNYRMYHCLVAAIPWHTYWKILSCDICEK